MTGEQIEKAKNLFREQAENEYRIKNNLKLTEKVPENITNEAFANAEKQVNSF